MKFFRRLGFKVLWTLWLLYFLSETFRNAPYEQNNNSDVDRTLQTELTSTSTKQQLIIHVGPPKTATTTIQEMLSMKEWQDLLSMDGFLYTGAFYKVDVEGEPYQRPLEIHERVRDSTCHYEMQKIRMQHKLQPSLELSLRDPILSKVRYYLLQLECVKSLLQALEQFKKSGTSLIVSDETINVRRLDLFSLFLLLRDDWVINIVVGYRRYARWLPSAKQQVERWKPLKNRSNKWLDEGGNKIENLFPNYWRNVSQSTTYMPYRFTDWIVDSVQAQVAEYISVRIMNMHSGSSIRTTFLCDTLPPNTFRHSCEVSHQKDVRESLDGELRIANPAQSNAYDQLTMEADAAGLIIKRHGKRRPRRRLVALAAQNYHETILNATLQDFPLVCPSRMELIAFLQASINLEMKILPEFHKTDQGERQHRVDFWKDVDRNMYCDIDATKILSNQQWANFFRQLKR